MQGHDGRRVTAGRCFVVGRLAWADRWLEIVALAEHALAYATSNAPGMFAWLVRNYEPTAQRFMNADDEEEARRRLRQHRFGAVELIGNRASQDRLLARELRPSEESSCMDLTPMQHWVIAH